MCSEPAAIVAEEVKMKALTEEIFKATVIRFRVPWIVIASNSFALADTVEGEAV